MSSREEFGKYTKRNNIRRRSMAALCLLLVVQIIIAVAAPAFAVVTGDVVIGLFAASNVRSGAGTGYGSIGYSVGGREYPFLAEAEGTDGKIWYKIQYTDSQTGWISSTVSAKLTAEQRKDPQNAVSVIAKAFGAVGVQAATIEDGVVTGSYYSGWAVKDSRAMTSDTKIRAASLSKVVIAMTAMKMREEGIVGLDTQIGQYWGTQLYKTVTLRNLLTHTSTLKDLSAASNADSTRTQLRTASSYNSGTPGAPGVWIYNNFGAAIAGSTLEMAANMNIDNYADNRFFNTLGIDAAWMSGRVDTTKLATLYRNDGSVARSATTSASLVGSDTPGCNTAYYAGGFTTSAAEYAKLIAILVNDGTYAGVRYLSADSVAQMEQTQFTRNSGSATGFDQCIVLRHMKDLYGQSDVYYHTGNAYGMLSLASYNPSAGNGVVVFTTGCSQSTDSRGIYSVCSSISRYLYEYMDRQPQKPATAIDIEQADIQLSKGDRMSIAPVLTPADSDSEIEWQSSCPACVEVSVDGTITAKGHGTAVITAKAGDVSDSCTVTVAPPDISMTMMGASVRVSDPYGLRFGVKLMKDSEFASADIVEYGTIIAFDEILGDGELTFDTPKVTRIPAKNIFQETDSYIIYTGVIINIPKTFFETDLVGRGYLIYRDADGTEHTIFSETSTRNFDYVAGAEYDSLSALDNLSSAQQSMLDKLSQLLGVEKEDVVVTPSDVAVTSDVPASEGVSDSDAAQPEQISSQEESVL